MKKYRISKYNPMNRDDLGNYKINDWTSYSDIGKEFNHKVFSVDEYISVEDKYIQILKMILQEENIEKLILKDLEKNFNVSEIAKFLNDYNLSLSIKEKELFKFVTNGVEIFLADVNAITRLLLRECLWCRLKSPEDDLDIEIGYDYYMYISCMEMSKVALEYINTSYMFIEELND